MFFTGISAKRSLSCAVLCMACMLLISGCSLPWRHHASAEAGGVERSMGWIARRTRGMALGLGGVGSAHPTVESADGAGGHPRRGIESQEACTAVRTAVELPAGGRAPHATHGARPARQAGSG